MGVAPVGRLGDLAGRSPRTVIGSLSVRRPSISTAEPTSAGSAISPVDRPRSVPARSSVRRPSISSRPTHRSRDSGCCRSITLPDPRSVVEYVMTIWRVVPAVRRVRGRGAVWRRRAAKSTMSRSSLTVGLRSGGGQIALGVVDCACQHVQVVVQRVEFASGDHQLAFAEFELVGSLARDPVPLAATLGTELSRSAGSAPLGQHSPAPPTSAPVPS